MKKTNVVWLGFCVPDHEVKKVFELDPIPAVQTHRFAWSFARCLRFAFGEVVLASSYPVQNFPLVRKIYFPKHNFKHLDFPGISLFFLNIIILKHLTRFLSCIFYVSSHCLRGESNLIFVHGLHSPYLLFGRLMQIFGAKIIVVMTDLPGLILPTDNLPARMLKRLDLRLIRLIVSGADGVISVAPKLSEFFSPFKNKLVVPGILNAALHPDPNSGFIDRRAPFVVSYAGGLSKAYGVDRLIDAVLLMDKDINLELLLYGKGDQVERIKRVSENDPRVRYCGYIDSDALFPLLIKSDLLINPRPSDESFSQMSFPSKIIEYMYTGRPVLTTRIQSIPLDMSGYLYYIEDESSNGIKNAMIDIMKISTSELNYIGMSGRSFVLNNYSESIIGDKIRAFVCSLGLEMNNV